MQGPYIHQMTFKSQKDGQLLERSHPPRRPKSSHTLDLVMDGPDCLKPIPLEAPSRASCSLLWLLPCLSASRSKSENQINTPASISSSRFSFPIVLCSSRIPTPTLSRPVAPPPRPPPPPLPTSFSLSLSPGVAACLPGPGAAPRGALPGRRPCRFGARRRA